MDAAGRRRCPPNASRTPAGSARPSSPRRPGGWSRASASADRSGASHSASSDQSSTSMRCADAEPRAVRVVRVVLREPELALEQAGAAARHRRPSVPAPSTGCTVQLAAHAVRGLVWPRSIAADGDAVDEAHAGVARLLAEEVLEDAAVDLVARRGEVRLAPSSSDAVDVAAALGEEEAEAELLQLPLLSGAPPGRAPCRSSWRRSRPRTRRPCAPPPAPDARRRSSTRMSRSGKSLPQLQRQREAGQAAAEDGDVSVHRRARRPENR